MAYSTPEPHKLALTRLKWKTSVQCLPDGCSLYSTTTNQLSQDCRDERPVINVSMVTAHTAHMYKLQTSTHEATETKEPC